MARRRVLVPPGQGQLEISAGPPSPRIPPAPAVAQSARPSSVSFEPVAQQFIDYYETLRGRVRRFVVRANLAQALPTRPARVIDIGCGDGADAMWLVRLGHVVTAVDPSPTMVSAATEAADRLPPAERRRVRILHGDDPSAVKEFRGEHFDLVLAHGVLMYQEDGQRFMSNLAELAADGGVVSVMTRNAAALAYRSAGEGRFRDALADLRQHTSTGRLGIASRAHTFKELRALLKSTAIATSAWYGVRVFTDALDQQVPPEYETDLIELELAASQIEPYRSSARLIHVIGRKRAISNG